MKDIIRYVGLGMALMGAVVLGGWPEAGMPMIGAGALMIVLHS